MIGAAAPYDGAHATPTVHLSRAASYEPSFSCPAQQTKTTGPPLTPPCSPAGHPITIPSPPRPHPTKHLTSTTPRARPLAGVCSAKGGFHPLGHPSPPTLAQARQRQRPSQSLPPQDPQLVAADQANHAVGSQPVRQAGGLQGPIWHWRATARHWPRPGDWRTVCHCQIRAEPGRRQVRRRAPLGRAWDWIWLCLPASGCWFGNFGD